MKKDTLYTGLGFLFVGAALFITGIVMHSSDFSSRLTSMGGGFMGPGFLMIYKYFHWSKPENSQAYQKKLEQEKISMHDERHIMLRSRAAHYMYKFTILVLALLLFICAFINMGKLILIILLGLLAFEIIGGQIVYKRLSNKL